MNKATKDSSTYIPDSVNKNIEDEKYQEGLDRYYERKVAEVIQRASAYASDKSKRKIPKRISWDPDGATCINTVTDNYEMANPGLWEKRFNVSGNETFQKECLDWGFQPLDSINVRTDMQQGDIVQLRGGTNNRPHHAMMFNSYDEEDGEPLFDYSGGAHSAHDMRYKHKYYDFYNCNPKVYRFVGTPAQKAKWKEEYDKVFYPYPQKISPLPVKIDTEIRPKLYK